MRFTETQIYMLGRLAHGAPLSEIARWDNRPLRGLYMRGLWDLCWIGYVRSGVLTREGQEVYKRSLRPSLRKHP